MTVVSEAMLCHRPQAHMSLSLSLLCFPFAVPCFQWTRHLKRYGHSVTPLGHLIASITKR